MENRTRRAESRKVSSEGRGKNEGLPMEGREGLIPEAGNGEEARDSVLWTHWEDSEFCFHINTLFLGNSHTEKALNEIG